MLTRIGKTLLLCMIGGAFYCFLEVLWRGYTHWSMFLVAALVTLPLDQLNEHMSWDTPIWVQAFWGGVGITLTELFSGILLNRYLNLGVWDYSHLPFQFLGQICLSYSLLWIVLAGLGIILFDWLRWRLFGEEMPHYEWHWHPRTQLARHS